MPNHWLKRNAVVTCIMFYYLETQNSEHSTTQHRINPIR